MTERDGKTWDGRVDDGIGGRGKRREGVWEGKEEGVKTGNFAKVPKFSVAVARRGTLVANLTD